jgi:hypothetical protein
MPSSGWTFWHELFDDRLYIELQRHGRPQGGRGRAAPDRLSPIEAAFRWWRPTNHSSSSSKEFEAHDALLAIAGGTVLAQTERRKLNDQYYFKTRAEMAELFSDLPEALDSTVEIAQAHCLSAAHARTDPAQIRRGFPCYGSRCGRWRQRRRLAAHGGRGSGQAYRHRLALRRARRKRNTGNGWISSSASSSR